MININYIGKKNNITSGMTDQACLFFPTFVKYCLGVGSTTDLYVTNALALEAIRADVCLGNIPHDQIVFCFDAVRITLDQDGRFEDPKGVYPEDLMALLLVMLDGSPALKERRDRQEAKHKQWRDDLNKLYAQNRNWSFMMQYNG